MNKKNLLLIINILIISTLILISDTNSMFRNIKVEALTCNSCNCEIYDGTNGNCTNNGNRMYKERPIYGWSNTCTAGQTECWYCGCDSGGGGGGKKKPPPPCKIVPNPICKDSNSDYIIGKYNQTNKKGIKDLKGSLKGNAWKVDNTLGTNNYVKSNGEYVLAKFQQSSAFSTGKLKYKGKSQSCETNVGIYRSPNATISIQQVDNCTNPITTEGLSEIEVKMINGTNIAINKTDNNGSTQFKSIGVINSTNCSPSSVASCKTDGNCKIETRFSIDETSLATKGYAACPNQSNWNRSGNIASTNTIISPINNQDMYETFKVYEVMPEINTPKWINISFGNYTVSALNFSMNGDKYGVYQDTLISKNGSIFSGTIDITKIIKNGSTGPSDLFSSGLVYIYNLEPNQNKIMPRLISNLNKMTLPNVTKRTKCDNKTYSDNILYYSGCSLTLKKVDVETNFKDLKLLIVEKDLAIEDDIDFVPFPIMVKGNLDLK